MTTLTEFLEARLAEDEAAARKAAAVSSPRWMANNSLLMFLDDSPTPPYAEALACTENYRYDDVWEHTERYDPARVLREVTAKRAILARESTVELPEWKPDCGGDWVLSGPDFFANYWPDNTVTASIGEDDGPRLSNSGIVSKESRAACQLFAEEWIREHLPEQSPVLRALAAVYSDHQDFRKEWAA